MTDGRYGGFWRRFFAYLIDMAIVCFISQILFLVSLIALGLSGDLMDRIWNPSVDLTRGMGAVSLLYPSAFLLAGMTYFTWFHGITGRTPGKKFFGLRMIQVSGEPPTPGIAFLRWTGYLVSGIVFFLGFLWIAFDRRKQGWHDKIAATLVILERADGADLDAYRNQSRKPEAVPVAVTGENGKALYGGSPDASVATSGVQLEKPNGDQAPPGPL